MADQNDTNIEEMKRASMGDPSAVMDPATPEGGSNHHRGADKDGGEKTVVNQGNSPKTKAAMIGDMVKTMNTMSAGSVKSAYKAFSSATGEMTPVMQGNSKIKESIKVQAGDIDVSDDVAAMFGDSDDLSEDFKSRVSQVFEAAVVRNVNAMLEDLTTVYEAAIIEEEENLVEKLDMYLDYTVDNWWKENTLAIDNGMRGELAEEFMKGLASLMETHYIKFPEDKIDVLDDLATHNESLEEALNSEMAKNIALSDRVEEYQKEIVFAEVSEDLSLTDTDRLASLAEGVQFDDEDSYRGKLETLVESYKLSESAVEDVLGTTVDTANDEPVDLDEEVNNQQVDPGVAKVSATLNRLFG